MTRLVYKLRQPPSARRIPLSYMLRWTFLVIMLPMMYILFMFSKQVNQVDLSAAPPSMDITGSETWGARPLSPPRQASFLAALEHLQVQGHDEATLSSMPSKPDGNITVIIHITLAEQATTFLFQSVLSQSLPTHEILVVCPGNLGTTIQNLVANYEREMRVIVTDMPERDFAPGTAGSVDGGWLHVVQQVNTKWVWVVNGDTQPTWSHLELMWHLQQSDAYGDALLGVQASVLPPTASKGDPTCLPSSSETQSRAVDMVHGPWLLKQEWLPYLILPSDHNTLSLPVPYYIGRTLKRYAGISSVWVPLPKLLTIKSENLCNKIRHDYHNNLPWQRLRDQQWHPTVEDVAQYSYSRNRVLFVVDGLREAVMLQPLMCAFEEATVAVTGVQRGLAGNVLATTLKEYGCGHVQVLDLDVPASTDIMSWIIGGVIQVVDAIQPRVMIHLGPENPIHHALATFAKQQQPRLAVISLPVKDVPFAKWISTLSVEALSHWNDVEVRLAVITDRRPHSLSRLLESASNAHYFGDRVDLIINMEQSADRVTRTVVRQSPWRHGAKTLRHRVLKGGLMPAIVDAWYPSHDHDYGVLLEDDVEVSPLFYAWTKYNILLYRYTPSERAKSPHLFGISLYSPRNLELLPHGRQPFNPDLILDNHKTPYVSQVPCSWGAVYFPEHWREFHQYLSLRLADLEGQNMFMTTVPRSRSERWGKSWKKYFIELVYLRAYVMLYPNFADYESFSTNHLEFGTHVKKNRDAIDTFQVPLMQKDTILDQLPQRQLPAFDHLPVLDLWGHRTTVRDLDKVGSQWHNRVSSCPRVVGRYDARDILCHTPVREKRLIAKMVDDILTIRTRRKPNSGSSKKAKKKKAADTQPRITPEEDEKIKLMMLQDNVPVALSQRPPAVDVSRMESDPRTLQGVDEARNDLASGLADLEQQLAPLQQDYS